MTEPSDLRLVSYERMDELYRVHLRPLIFGFHPIEAFAPRGPRRRRRARLTAIASMLSE